MLQRGDVVKKARVVLAVAILKGLCMNSVTQIGEGGDMEVFRRGGRGLKIPQIAFYDL